jgi:Protein of unknown function (DUF3159)
MKKNASPAHSSRLPQETDGANYQVADATGEGGRESVSWWKIAGETLRQPGRISGFIVTAAPTVVFVIVNAFSSLYPALYVTAATAVAAMTYRLIRRQSLKGAIIGLLIVAACALVAAIVGQARGFFLIPALVPFVILSIGTVSLIARRPLTGILLNRISGGPSRWYESVTLRRVFTIGTLVVIAVDGVDAALQVVFYLANNTFVLAAAHIAVGPIFAIVVAVTIVFARRTMSAKASPRAEA